MMCFLKRSVSLKASMSFNPVRIWIGLAKWDRLPYRSIHTYLQFEYRHSEVLLHGHCSQEFGGHGHAQGIIVSYLWVSPRSLVTLCYEINALP